MREPNVVIAVGMANNKINTNTELADRIGMVRQTLSHKRKYPSTFTGGEIGSLAKTLKWTDEEIAEFIRGISC